MDDEPAIRFSLAELLGADGHDVREAEHAPAALARLEVSPAELVFTDLRMPAVSGLELLEAVRAHHPDTLVVLVTAHGDERTAVQALKRGAWDYLPKPFDNDEIRAVVARAAELLALRRENRALRDGVTREFRGIVGTSAAMRELVRTVRRAGPSDATVLVTGESGTGKELVARALHGESRRAKGLFLALNCSAMPVDLVESQLFGHVRGAFTGADRDRAGLFEDAAGGTVFLDEIGDLAPNAQAKLLRVLEAREVTRLGANRPTAVDARVVAATNQRLEELVRQGHFRADLRYRLDVITIHVPPLRERREDIGPLLVHFLSGMAEARGAPPKTVSEDARRTLLAYDWPGNVRELRNVVERALVLVDGEEITTSDLPAPLLHGPAALRPTEAALADLPLGEARARARAAFDHGYLSAALERHGHNISRTAAALGLHRQTLQRILRRLGVRVAGSNRSAGEK